MYILDSLWNIVLNYLDEDIHLERNVVITNQWNNKLFDFSYDMDLAFTNISEESKSFTKKLNNYSQFIRLENVYNKLKKFFCRKYLDYLLYKNLENSIIWTVWIAGVHKIEIDINDNSVELINFPSSDSSSDDEIFLSDVDSDDE